MHVKLRDKGRITIPASIRKALGLRQGDQLQLSVERGAIVLRPERVVTAEDIKGIIGPAKVEIEEVEEALGRDLS
jgi:AbrB family looped-hinge helix DNA binding protein